jgi:hypothetical protein
MSRCYDCGKRYEQGPEPAPFIQGSNVSFGRARVQPDGSLIYPKKGWEPPPPPGSGYERDPGNKWRFIALWPACLMRQRVMIKKLCGAVSIKHICKCSECPLFQNDVNLTHCEGCEHRRE